MNRTVLVLDVETTGLDPKVDKIIELGWALWDADDKRLIHAGGEYIRQHDVELSREIQDLTGIDQAWLERYAVDWFDVVEQLPRGYSCYAAHNALFDRDFLDKQNGASAAMPTLLWIDTRTDLPFVKQPDSRKLKYLALDHGIPPTLSHRAMFDAVQTALLLGKYDFDKVLERAKSPAIKVQAQVSYDDRDKAKTMGFYWVPADKAWRMDIKQMDLAGVVEAAKKAGFRVAPVPPDNYHS